MTQPNTTTSPTTPTEETVDDIRQAERKRGMPTVLAISTAIAAGALLIFFIVTVAG